MTRVVRWGLLVIALVTSPGATHAQPTSPRSPKGAETQVVLAGASRPVTVRGELLAVDSAKVWVLTDSRVTAIPRTDITGLKVRVHKFGGMRAFLTGLVGGVLTTVGMGVACGSVEDSEGCPGFVAAWGTAWLLVTGISAAFMEGNSWDALPLSDWSRIATHARFPQGMPPSMITEGLTGEP